MQGLFKLECPVQEYAWGGQRLTADGPPPYIADLLAIDAPPGKPFAELWIGAHPKSPSRVIRENGQSQPLNEVLADDPEFWLGPALAGQGMRTLPFLLKILDSAKPLSIQAHPDRELAAILHCRDPENYPDANHKPEVAIALEPGLEAFCGFRPVAEILDDIRRLQALSRFFSKIDEQSSDRQRLENFYRRLFTAEPAEINAVLGAVSQELADSEARNVQDRVFLRLLKEYPEDRGALSAYFLNIINLAPGQAVFLEPGEPHAYLRGTIIECMASSDNVVRAGLTSKFIDRETLLQMLSYKSGRPEILEGELSAGGESRIYRGPAPEFQVEMIGPEHGDSEECHSDAVFSFLLILEGEVEFGLEAERQIARRGTVWAWPAAVKHLRIRSLQKGSKVVRTRVNLSRELAASQHGTVAKQQRLLEEQQ